MTPELGKYASEVYSAYAAAGALLAILIVMTLVKSRRVAAQLHDLEAHRAATKRKAQDNG